MKIHKGDNVLVIKGKDRGKSGKVVRAIPKEQRIVVAGLNMRKKTIRPKRQGEHGQIVEIAWPMRVENVMLICSKCGKATRVGYRKEKDTKVRYCKKCKEVI